MKSKEEVRKAGEAILAKMKGTGWELELFENFGWHYNLRNGGFILNPIAGGKFMCRMKVPGIPGSGDFVVQSDGKANADPNKTVVITLCDGEVNIERAQNIIDELKFGLYGQKGREHGGDWEKFWKPLVCNPDGSLNEELVKAELADYSMVMGIASEVYCHVTGNQVSKCNTFASVIMGIADDQETKRQKEAVEEAVKEERERLVAIVRDAGGERNDGAGNYFTFTCRLATKLEAPVQ